MKDQRAPSISTVGLGGGERRMTTLTLREPRPETAAGPSSPRRPGPSRDIAFLASDPGPAAMLPRGGLGAVAPGDTLLRKPGPEDPGRRTGLRRELFHQLPAGVQSVFVCLSKILYFFLSIFVLTAVLTLEPG